MPKKQLNNAQIIVTGVTFAITQTKNPHTARPVPIRKSLIFDFSLFISFIFLLQN